MRVRAEQCAAAVLGFCRGVRPAWPAAAHAAAASHAQKLRSLKSPCSPGGMGRKRAHLARLRQGGDHAVVLGGIRALQRHLQLVILAHSVHRELLQAGQGRRQRRSGSARGAALEQVPAGHPLLPPAASGGPGDGQTQAVWRRPPDASSPWSPPPPVAPGLGPGGQRCSARSSSHPGQSAGDSPRRRRSCWTHSAPCRIGTCRSWRCHTAGLQGGQRHQLVATATPPTANRCAIHILVAAVRVIALPGRPTPGIGAQRGEGRDGSHGSSYSTLTRMAGWEGKSACCWRVAQAI